MNAHSRLLSVATAIVFFARLSSPLVAQDQKSSKESEASRRFADRIEAIVDDVLRSLRFEFGHVDSSFHFPSADTSLAVIDTAQESLSYDGPTTIAAGDTIVAHVVVKGGDLTVSGVVRGDVLVIGGSLLVKSGGRVMGNARVTNGEISREDGGVIDGTMDELGSTAAYRARPEQFALRSYCLDAWWAPEHTTVDHVILRYNRVENIFLGLGSEKRYYWDASRELSIYGSVGYGFKSYQWRGHLGLTRQFAFPDNEAGSSHLLEIGGEAHSFTDSKDAWLIDARENSLAAFFIHEDFRDYFERQGFTLLAGWYYRRVELTTQVRAEMNFDEETSMPKRTDWALFGGEKRFRENPAITEGRMRSVVLSAGVSTAAKTRHGMEGWAVYGSAEFSGSALASEFSFSQLTLDARRYQPIGRHDGIHLRIRAGTSGGSLPVQRNYETGGLGTLPGFPFKDQAGNRLLLGNFEYFANGRILGDLDFWPRRVMEHINIIFFGDAGWVGLAPPDATWTDGFESLTLATFRSDLGFGFSSRTGAFRLGWAWRTDKSEPARFVFRISRPF